MTTFDISTCQFNLSHVLFAVYIDTFLRYFSGTVHRGFCYTEVGKRFAWMNS